MSARTGHEVQEIRERCRDVLASPAFSHLTSLVRERGLHLPSVAAALEVRPASHAPLVQLRRDAGASGSDEASPERLLLLEAALYNAARIPGLPVAEEVRRATFDAFCRLIEPTPELAAKLTLGHSTFLAACKILTLRRFPAGDFEWEVSGIPRSLLLRVDRRRLPRLLWLLAFQLRGFRPLFMPHMSIFRAGHLGEAGGRRAYCCMARSMDLQPQIRGLVAISWLRSPGLRRISPHLAWLATIIADNGGFVADAGPAGPDSGALSRSRTRRRLHEEGRYVPMRGIAVWPREAMLRWAAGCTDVPD